MWASRRCGWLRICGRGLAGMWIVASRWRLQVWMHKCLACSHCTSCTVVMHAYNIILYTYTLIIMHINMYTIYTPEFFMYANCCEYGLVAFALCARNRGQAASTLEVEVRPSLHAFCRCYMRAQVLQEVFYSSQSVQLRHA